MGSVLYARRCALRNEKVVAMMSIESVGDFNDAEESQAYPPLLSAFYPSKGNFIAFAGNLGSRGLVRRSIHAFRGGRNRPIGRSGASGNHPGDRLVRSVIFLAIRLQRIHGYGYDRLARVVDGLIAVVDSRSSK